MKTAIAAYQQTRLMVQSTKGLERQLLLQRYSEFEQAAAQEDVFVMLQAVASQRELWVTIRALLLDEDHPFPSGLKQQLLDLAQTILEQLQSPLSEMDVELILAVNLQLAQGLGSD